MFDNIDNMALDSAVAFAKAEFGTSATVERFDGVSEGPTLVIRFELGVQYGTCEDEKTCRNAKAAARKGGDEAANGEVPA